jgi:uncharacterized protein (TIGR00369 family)
MDTAIERDEHCFCCGADNEKGLHLVFSYPAKGEAAASLRVPEYFSGWKSVTHGGFLSMLLDEAMAHACLADQGTAADQASAARRGDGSAVTAEITVRFLKPVETGTQVRVAGKVVQTKGRIISTEGQVYDEQGEVAAQASARFIAAKKPAT